MWSVADAVNYLLSEDELVSAFESFRRNLAPGGVVVFDVDTLCTFRALYSSVMVVPGDDRTIVFEGRTPGAIDDGAIGEAWIDRLERADAPWWDRVRTVHRQRHHPQDDARANARRRRSPSASPRGGPTGPAASNSRSTSCEHVKAVYIAQHAAPAREGR